MEKAKKVQLGDYGFLKKQKLQYVLKMIGYIVGGLIMFWVGCLVNKGDPKNICSVLALLMALPLAKAFTELVVIFPFKDIEKERYDRVAAVCPKDSNLMTGLVITSEKKIMNLDFLFEYEGNVIALVGAKEDDVSYVSDYLTRGVRNWGFDYNVKVLKEEKAYRNAIQNCKPIKVSEQEQKNVMSYLKSLIVK